MILGIPKEILDDEMRVAALPETVPGFLKMGFDVLVQSSAGDGALQSDAEYMAAGTQIVDNPEELFARSNVILKVKQPWFNKQAGRHEVEMMQPGTLLVSFLHPAAPSNHEMIKMLAEKNVTAMTMDGIPRISRAQTMDALTSMSTITGYKSVLIGANRCPKFIPMIGTAIGMIKPAKFFIIGTGVVGLQAIATAKRLGASIMALDIMEEAQKAADSLGAKIVGFDVPGEVSVGEGGYAQALPEPWLEKERKAIEPHLQEADVVILSALVPGEVAPVLITEEMVQKMKPGSVIIDVSIDQGGNCQITEAGHECVKHRVHLCGLWNIPGSMPVHASWLYAHNVLHFVENLFKNGTDAPDYDDEIVQHSLVVRHGQIVHQGILKALNKKEA
ncbi:MAG: NAD(P) transhydrogenase subunit alpha [Pirellulales bacterium]|nr:NAD(P) transhydrogenase subunit alpha [Pirellulales bacterium]